MESKRLRPTCSVHLDLIDIVRVRGEQIVEHWNIVDSSGLMHQRGAVLGPDRPGDTLRRTQPRSGSAWRSSGSSW
ncbi:MAG TPA: hypothetical protein VF972_11625, partial [Actinomycetota bacterium]